MKKATPQLQFTSTTGTQDLKQWWGGQTRSEVSWSMSLTIAYLLTRRNQKVYAASLYHSGNQSNKLQVQDWTRDQDGLVNNWLNYQLCTFPLLSLLPFILQHSETMQVILLIASFFMTRPWFCLLMTLGLGPSSTANQVRPIALEVRLWPYECPSILGGWYKVKYTLVSACAPSVHSFMFSWSYKPLSCTVNSFLNQPKVSLSVLMSMRGVLKSVETILTGVKCFRPLRFCWYQAAVICQKKKKSITALSNSQSQ